MPHLVVGRHIFYLTCVYDCSDVGMWVTGHSDLAMALRKSIFSHDPASKVITTIPEIDLQSSTLRIETCGAL